MRYPRHLATLALLAIIPLIPCALFGYAGQDLPFHLSSWLDLRDAWLTGRLTPGWSPAANLGLGDPHLTLYPPFSLYLGGLLTLLLPLRLAPAAFLYLCALVGGIAMHLAGRHLLRDRDRLPAAALCMLSPYLIATALVRFAAAELLVMAWLPLLLLCLHQTLWPTPPTTPTPDPSADHAEAPADPSPRRPILLLALLLALTWITDIPAAILLLYAFAAAALACAWLQRSFRPLLRLALAEALAAALAAFYLAPALAESHWVSASALTRTDPGLLLLFMPQSTLPPALRNNPLVFACWLFLCVQTLLLIHRVPHVSTLRRGPSAPNLTPAAARTATLTSLALAAILFQTPLAYPLWLYLPELRFVQFPFRFLALLGAVLPLLLFAPQPELAPPPDPKLLPRRSPRSACLALGALSLIALLGYLSMTGLTRRRIPPLATFAARGTTAPEYLPAGATPPTPPLHLQPTPNPKPVSPPQDPPQDRPQDQLQDQLQDQPAPPPSNATPTQTSPNLRVLRTRNTSPCRLRLALFDYPFWRASDESLHPLSTARDPSGLLLIEVPAGDHLVSVAFHPASTTRTASAILSLLALTLTAALFFTRAPRRPA